MLLGRREEGVRTGAELLRIAPALTLHSLPIEPVRREDAKTLFYKALSDAGVPE